MVTAALALSAGRWIALLLWAALAFWAFSFSFSASYFSRDLPVRLPLFLAAFAGAVALPVSAYRQWQRARGGASRLAAWLVHAASAVLCVIPLAGTAALLGRIGRK